MPNNKHLQALNEQLGDLIKNETDPDRSIAYASLKAEIEMLGGDLDSMEANQVKLVERFNQQILATSYKPLNDKDENPSQPERKSFDEIASEIMKGK